MGLFNKEITCERCRTTFPKKQMSTFDTTHQNRNKYSYAMNVCQDCLLASFYESLRNYNDLAVVIAPIQRYNAYVSYDFDYLIKVEEYTTIKNDKTRWLVNDLKALLPERDSKCVKCSQNATYTWCPSEIINNNPFSWKVNWNALSLTEHLCKECLINAFSKKIKEENIRFEAIYPPISGSGFLCSWDI